MKLTKTRVKFFLLIFLIQGLVLNQANAQDYAAEIKDPWENYNRAIFKFNDKFDINVAKPVAQGYDYITPDFLQTGVGNFFDNLSTPSYFLSSVLQGKVSQSILELSRFVINSTVGLVGLIDVAKHVDIPKHKEDFGLAFAEWGIGPGPFFVIPFVGPSNMRDATGLVFDRLTNPMYWVGSIFDTSSSKALIISSSATVIEFTDTRASLLDAIDTAKESSLDYYLFVQSAYYQHRLGLLYDGNPPDDESWMNE